MSETENSLPIPKPALNDNNSQEVVRAWVAENSMHFSYLFGQWQTKVWGVFIADLIRQLVSEEYKENKTDRKETLRVIMDILVDEINKFGEELGFEQSIK